MVVGIEASIFEVVVLATGPDTFLAIDYAGGWRRALPQEVGDKGVHPGIGEEEIGRAGEQGCRGEDAVAFGGKKIEKGLTDFNRNHGGNQFGLVFNKLFTITACD